MSLQFDRDLDRALTEATELDCYHDLNQKAEFEHTIKVLKTYYESYKDLLKTKKKNTP